MEAANLVGKQGEAWINHQVKARVIYTLSATPVVTKILATVSKHIASIANDYLDFQLNLEKLRRSRMMSDSDAV